MPVVVNGIPRDIKYRRCVKCIHDSSVPGISFDENGVCSLCKLYDLFDREFPNDRKGLKTIKTLVRQIKKDGRNKPYDCVIGISGGRDSTFLLYLAVKKWGLRPLAVHFNDGFDNPVAGENMLKATEILGVKRHTVTSDWRESRDLKIAELYASTPHMNSGTDVGIGAACYGTAADEGIKHVLIGQSFRTEGVKPISWAFFCGDYLKDISRKFGKVPLKQRVPGAPGYNLGLKELAYYSLIKGIRLSAPLYNFPYIRKDVDKLLSEKLDWVYPGAHYYDDLYWALITYVQRVKFNVDLRINSYSFLIRSGQMSRDEALKLINKPYVIEDPAVIELCLRRLAIDKNEFDKILKLPPATFNQYRSSYDLLSKLKPLIWIACHAGLLPSTVYHKYFTLKWK